MVIPGLNAVVQRRIVIGRAGHEWSPIPITDDQELGVNKMEEKSPKFVSQQQILDFSQFSRQVVLDPGLSLLEAKRNRHSNEAGAKARSKQRAMVARTSEPYFTYRQDDPDEPAIPPAPQRREPTTSNRPPTDRRKTRRAPTAKRSKFRARPHESLPGGGRHREGPFRRRLAHLPRSQGCSKSPRCVNNHRPGPPNRHERGHRRRSDRNARAENRPVEGSSRAHDDSEQRHAGNFPQHLSHGSAAQRFTTRIKANNAHRRTQHLHAPYCLTTRRRSVLPVSTPSRLELIKVIAP